MRHAQIYDMDTNKQKEKKRAKKKKERWVHGRASGVYRECVFRFEIVRRVIRNPTRDDTRLILGDCIFSRPTHIFSSFQNLFYDRDNLPLEGSKFFYLSGGPPILSSLSFSLFPPFPQRSLLFISYYSSAENAEKYCDTLDKKRTYRLTRPFTRMINTLASTCPRADILFLLFVRYANI